MPRMITELEQRNGPRNLWEPIRPPRWREMPAGTTLRFGRDSAIEIGTDPVDRKVSGRAVELCHDGERWHITATNRHGVDLYRWGQAARPLTVGVSEPVVWPRIALYVRGDEAAYQHWILCDDPTMPTLPPDRTTTDTERTPQSSLTARQLEAVYEVFEDLLAWPPRYPSRPRSPKEAAGPLGVKEDGVRRLLESARAKAAKLGPIGNSLDDPTYIHTLVSHGCILPQISDVDSRIRPPSTLGAE